MATRAASLVFLAISWMLAPSSSAPAATDWTLCDTCSAAADTDAAWAAVSSAAALSCWLTADSSSDDDDSECRTVGDAVDGLADAVERVVHGRAHLADLVLGGRRHPRPQVAAGHGLEHLDALVQRPGQRSGDEHGEGAGERDGDETDAEHERPGGRGGIRRRLLDADRVGRAPTSAKASIFADISSKTSDFCPEHHLDRRCGCRRRSRMRNRAMI